MNEDLVETVALALHVGTGCQLPNHDGHVSDYDRQHARTCLHALATELLDKAAEWDSPDLIDAAQWIEGEL